MESQYCTNANDWLVSSPKSKASRCFEYAVEVLDTIGKESFYHFLSQRSAADSDAILKAALQILFAQTKLVSARGASLWRSQILKMQIPKANTTHHHA